MWFQVVGGLYYAIAGGYLLTSWLGTDYDVAKPQDARFKKEVGGEFGFLGFQAGLFAPQIVDELHWATRVPFEFKLRRNVPDPSKVVDMSAAAAEEQRLPGPGMYYLVNGKLQRLRQEVDMTLVVEWWDCSGKNEQISSTYVTLKGKTDFIETTLEDMASENQGNSGRFIILDSASATANPEKKDVPVDHPKYFGIVYPLDMGFSVPGLSMIFPPVGSTVEDIELSWKARIAPGPGYTVKDLREWLNFAEPQSVVLDTIDATDDNEQDINYDYW